MLIHSTSGLPKYDVEECATDPLKESLKPYGLSANTSSPKVESTGTTSTHIPLPNSMSQSFSGTPDEVAQAYEERLAVLGGVQMQFLGIGADAHLGFCRPGTPFCSSAHAVQLPEDTRQMLHRKYALEIEKLPHYGVTLGLKSIMQIPELIVIATGKGKARAVYDSLHRAPDESIPASILQLHPHVTWLLDAEAASLL